MKATADEIVATKPSFGESESGQCTDFSLVLTNAKNNQAIIFVVSFHTPQDTTQNRTPRLIRRFP